jgi:hypothetical protein
MILELKIAKCNLSVSMIGTGAIPAAASRGLSQYHSLKLPARRGTRVPGPATSLAFSHE